MLNKKFGEKVVHGPMRKASRRNWRGKFIDTHVISMTARKVNDGRRKAELKGNK